MINDGTEVWQDDTCQGGIPHITLIISILYSDSFRIITRPARHYSGEGLMGEAADVIICFTILRLEEVWLRGITTKIELDRLNAELVVEDII